MRLPRVIPAALSLVTLGALAVPARAGWSTDPVTISPTTADIPLVEACTDGAHGTFVAWQEAGQLRVQHLLVSGDLDPAWPAAGAVAAGTAATRTELFLLPDRIGGLYLFWEQSNSLYALRVDGTGAVASGWPVGGRALGGVMIYSMRPSIIEDGAHGFYAVWSGNGVMATHLGPSNTGAGGWPNTVKSFEASGPIIDFWPQVAPAPDGGVFMAWATWLYDAESDSWSGVWRLRRFTSAGVNAPGWSTAGIEFGEFHGENIAPYFPDGWGQRSLLALSADGRGGAFLMIGNPHLADPGIETRVYRIQGDGSRAIDWPSDGRFIQDDAANPWAIDASYRLFSDRHDGVLMGIPAFYSEGYTTFDFDSRTSSGQRLWTTRVYPVSGFEVVQTETGELWTAAMSATGPFGLYQPCALLHVSQSNPPAGWVDFDEQHCETAISWYGDIGLAATEDGGAVFVWSQVRDRVGLFARKFNAFGEVTGVPPVAAAPAGLGRLFFDRGAGIRASLSAPGGGTLDLFDLAGRRIAGLAIGDDDREVTLPGTAEIGSGLYFARLRSAAGQFSGKVLVTR